MRVATLFGILCVTLSVPLLYVGLTSVLVAFDVEVTFLGQTFTAVNETRSLLGHPSMVDALWAMEAYVPCGALLLFGIVIPVFKFILFSLWLAEIGGVEGSFKVMRFAQSISKWAAVDACVEAVTVGMLLKLHGVSASHGVAFPCFVLYCVVSTIAFLCLPGEVSCDDSEPNAVFLWFGSFMNTPAKRILPLMLTLNTFVLFLAIGGGAHMTRMWVPKEGIADGVMDNAALHDLPDVAKQAIIDQIARTNDLSARVSLSGCIHRLFTSEHLNTQAGSILLFFCVIFMPVLYAVMNMAKALWVSSLADDEDKKSLMNNDSGYDQIITQAPAFPVLDKLRAFAHDLSMIDVMVAGILLATFVTTSEHDIKCELGHGFKYLVMAAVAWYFHNFTCAAVQASAKIPSQAPLEPASEPAPTAAVA